MFRRTGLLTSLALLIAVSITGCAGGPIAQQIASSVATQAADKVVGNIVDERLRLEREPRSVTLKDIDPDPDTVKLLTMQFRESEEPQMVVEPLPAYVEIENGKSGLASSRLVSVEVLNLVIGQEKLAVFERSLQNGSPLLPPPTAWRDWQLATGNLQGHRSTQLYFLIPPDFGKVLSGDLAIVEIATTGGLHIARHRAN